MPDLADGQSVEMQGSAARPYVLKNVGGVYSCSCPAWRNQSLPIDRRTCKHLRQYRGEEAEQARVGTISSQIKQPAADKLVPPLLLAHAWDNEQDMMGWWMSEKLDGVRAYWDGKRFLSRQGNVFHAPDWFTKGLPPIPLDGELWMDRKRFQPTVSIVRRQNGGEHWKGVKYVVFDAPAPCESFEARYAIIKLNVREDCCPYVRTLYQVKCDGIDHLQRELTRIESLGGEGLMLRKPASLYEAGRSHTLLKVKRFHDAEARVVQHLPGSGRHKGRLGALLVETPGGVQFSVGTGLTDAQREKPPALGSTITLDGGLSFFISSNERMSDKGSNRGTGRPACRS